MKPNTELTLAVLALALLPGLGWAQDAAATTVAASTTSAQPSKVDQTKDQLTKLPSAADLKPTGPLTINANYLESRQGNSAIYSGKVTVDSDTLKMDGDRLELKRAADGQYTARITGAPAHMSHAGSGPDNPPMTAQAKVMTYDSRSSSVNLDGDAQMTKGDERTTAEKISYNFLEQRYQASGGGDGSGGRVQIVIPQVTAPAATTPQTPATAPTAPAPATAAPPQAKPSGEAPK